jgi:NTE family protein
MQEQITHYVLEKTKPDIIIKVPRDICSTFEFHKSKKLIELGKFATKAALQSQQNS